MTPSIASRIILSVLLLTSGCRSAPTGPREGEACNPEQWLGSFEGSVAGAESDTLSGCAFYSVMPASTAPSTEAEGLPTSGMMLTDGAALSAGYRIRILKTGGFGPATFVVGSNIGQLYGRVSVPGNDGVFLLSSGSLSITGYFNGHDLAGTLSLTATDTVTAVTITITGEFRATCIDIPVELTNDDLVDPTRSGACRASGAS